MTRRCTSTPPLHPNFSDARDSRHKWRGACVSHLHLKTVQGGGEQSDDDNRGAGVDDKREECVNPGFAALPNLVWHE